MRIRLLVAFVLGAAILFGQAAPNGDYVGSEVCSTCHQGITDSFYKNPHFKSVVLGDRPAEETGCESCHGPAAPHLRAGGGRDSIPRAFSLLSAAKTNEACLTCHSEDIAPANLRTSPHGSNGLSCSSCHSIHQPQTTAKLLQKAQLELCSSCHRNAQAQFSLPFKHRVQEGFMSCSDCHNPHSAPAQTGAQTAATRLLQPGRVNEQTCLECHNEKRGPFVFEHPGVRVDGCQTCHEPHGSTNSRLLTRPVVFTLCLECHNGADDFGRQVNGVQVQSARHNLADPRYQNCTTCHVRIHGSNADVNFLR